MTDEEIRKFREAAQIILTLLRCISMKRALHVTERDELNFFRLYDGCLMDVAAISWCKIFGTDAEESHWKKLFPEDERRQIRSELQSSLENLNLKFGDLWEETVSYRNKYVSHLCLDKNQRPSTHIDLAPLQATGFTIYEKVFEKLKGPSKTEGLSHPSEISNLRLRSIEEHWRKIAMLARDATKNLKDAPS